MRPLDPQNMALTRCRWSSGVIDAARRSQTRRSFTIAHNVWSQSGPNRGHQRWSSVEGDGLGEELRVLLAHSMRNGHHQLPRPGGMTRLDPVR